MDNDTQSLTVEQVLQYLQETTDFFIQNPQALESLELVGSPDGTISFTQRQTDRLRFKNEQLKEQLHTLIDNARQNSDLQERVHQLCLRLMDTSGLDELLPLLVKELKQEFGADEVALRLFYNEENTIVLPEMIENVINIHIDDASLAIFDGILSRQQPVCGRLTKAQKILLFSDRADDIQSVACLPLGHKPCAGLLAIASTDPNRFHSDMGTVYLAFLGEILMRLLRKYCHSDYDN